LPLVWGVLFQPRLDFSFRREVNTQRQLGESVSAAPMEAIVQQVSPFNIERVLV
jgi:hypothetical protein